MRRPDRIARITSAAVLIATASLFVLAPSARSQVITLTPQCGVAGTTVVSIAGSGWAEPQPPCEYIFYFDGAEVAPRQPDGLYGPPASSFTVPGGAAVGCHIVKVELRITDGQQLIQCRQDTLRVIAAEADPWTVTLDPDSSGITIEFDPTSVCDIDACESIYFIQTRMCTGTRNNGTTRRVTYVEQGWANAAQIDNTFTGTGTAVDRIFGAPVPYYGVPGGNSTLGKAGKQPMKATMYDRPGRGDGSYPTAPDTIVKLTLDFEVNVFCGSGSGRGKYMGQFAWSWSRTKGVAGAGGKVTTGATTRNQPSANFGPAVTLWGQKNSFTLPTAGPPTQGGQACN